MAVGSRRTADRLLEVDPEKRLIGEIQQVGDLLNRILAALQQRLGLENHIVANPVAGMASADGINHLREVFRGQAESVGIELNAALRGVVLPQLLEKTVKNLPFARPLSGVLLLDQRGHQLTDFTVEHLQVALQDLVLEPEVWLAELFAQGPAEFQYLGRLLLGELEQRLPRKELAHDERPFAVLLRNDVAVRQGDKHYAAVGRNVEALADGPRSDYAQSETVSSQTFIDGTLLCFFKKL